MLGGKMHLDKEKVLRDNYPFFNEDLKIECGDGWFDIIKNLCDELIQLRQPFLGYIKLSVIKQKFGVLCVYYSTEEYLVDEVEDFINNAINIATEDSRYVCEKCGKPGKIKKIAIAFFTRCDNCPQ